ncbi:Transcriptional regulator, MarR family [Sulfitobacter noctilucicola]|uniref:DNA-binding MarR family transcriptional regulator n=1 Tax=Sulfitobacter noctilucicola TaxID=1342301 RepID=A0A7W6Q3D9_9RHOB|nr:MarR family winged helix-turn-helix transcriptional regulator [Sulfitobacter noctilucicola]KIN62464.1 Transcriptional regulator, MarR family [Sulfitobacter noctilucicola]MBB4173004.1 DNA-binding MarR family transcriptional regulator [Sulfitobacter noctilucicola]
MNGGLDESFDGTQPVARHPKAVSIEDVITFRLQRMVSIGERAGHHWSERLFDLSLNEWRLLALVKSRAPCRAGDMADLLLMDKSQTSRVIKALLSKELIKNMPDPLDGRAISLHTTEAGDTLYARIFNEVLKSNERVLSPLSPEEVQTFNAMLERLIEHSENLLEARLGRDLVR